MLCDHRVIDHLLVWLLCPEPIAAEQLLAYISYCFLLSIVVIWLLKTQSVVLCFCEDTVCTTSAEAARCSNHAGH